MTPEGFSLSYEVLLGNVRDEGPLTEALEAIERRHGNPRRDRPLVITLLAGQGPTTDRAARWRRIRLSLRRPFQHLSL